jgi:general secretion pathway protein J
MTAQCSLCLHARARAVRKGSRGFTLAEVLVALALMALLATMSWRGVSSMAEAKQRSDARVNDTLRLGTVLAQWEQDLQQLYDTPLVPALAFDGKTVRMVRRQGGGLQVVAWALNDVRWTRWISPVATSGQGLQDAWLASQQLLGNEPGQLTLYEGLVGWQIYFYRVNAWSNAQSSAGTISAQNPGTDPQVPVIPGTPATPTARKSDLPDGVRVVLTLQQQGEGQGGSTVTRDLRLAPQ